MPKWDTKAIQGEFCQLCGNLVDNTRLVEPDVEGLRGFRICSTHRFERAAATNPSYNDLKAFSMPPIAPEAGTRMEPIGLEPWYDDGEALLAGPAQFDWLMVGPDPDDLLTVS